MPDPALRIAVTAGPMYDALYERIGDFVRDTGVAVDFDFRGPHPELNLHMATTGGTGCDLVSTHTKYAPSQKEWLAPLDELEQDLLGGDFFPPLVDLARIDHRLYGVPRNLDVRLLHYRTDVIERPPDTWDELFSNAKRHSRPPDFYGFVFCGVESGLFGTFYEWVECAGAKLFPESLIPEVNNNGGRWALGLLRELYKSGAAPPALANWHYDEVHRCFRDGHAAMVCDWPGYYSSYRHTNSAVAHRFAVARMPAGPTGRRAAYAGCHTFALTQEGIRKPHAIALLRFLTAPEQQLLEAQRGSVPVRHSVIRAVQESASGEDAERWRLLHRVIESDLIIPPKLSYYPNIEEILWRTVRAATVGEIGIETALEEIEQQISACVRRHATHAA